MNNVIGAAKSGVKNYCGNVLKMAGNALLKPNEYLPELVSILKHISFWRYGVISNKGK